MARHYQRRGIVASCNPSSAIQPKPLVRCHRRTRQPAATERHDYERGWTEIHEDANSLRRFFGLAPDTKLVLSCVDKDRRIEPVWRELHEKGFMRYLRRLNFAAVNVPNFSLFDRDSRYQHEYNRKRSLIVAKELTRFGIPALPNFHAMSPGDIWFWRDFLRSRPEITCLSLEFQTGLGDDVVRANATIDELGRLQQDLGRSLHLVAVGGASFMDRIALRFPSSTLITSRPYILAVMGRKMLSQPSGAFGEARDHAPRGKLFQQNHRLAMRACREARRRSKLWRLRRRHGHSLRGAQQLMLPMIAYGPDHERPSAGGPEEHPPEQATLDPST